MHAYRGLIRFASYDFKKMHRRSYYPTNAQIASQMTGTSSSGLGVESSRPVTPSVNAHELQSVHAMVPEGFSETERFGVGVPMPDHTGYSEKQPYRS
jgi:hypothetical protein